MTEQNKAAEGVSRGNASVLIGLLALSAGLLWAWWDSFHEMFRFLGSFSVNSATDSATFMLGGLAYAQCFTKPLGVIAGCLVVLLARKGLSGNGDSRAPESRGLWEGNGFVLLVAQVALTIANGLARAASKDTSITTCLIYGLATVVFVLFLVRLGLAMRRLPLSQCAAIFTGALGVYGLCNNLVFPLVLLNLAVWPMCAIYVLVALAAYLLQRRALASLIGDLPSDNPNPEGLKAMPWRLAVHLVAYGFVFGLLHILEGLIQQGPYSVNIGVFFGAVLAAGIFYGLVVRSGEGRELWSKMQSTVFPLVIIGFVLVPQLADSNAVLALTEAGQFLYLGFLIMGCQIFMRRTDVGDITVMAVALLFYSIGEGAGVIAGVSMYPAFDAAHPSFATLTALIILLLTAATFWVAPADQVHKLWGLRRNLTPKRYNDLLVQGRVRSLSESFGLTARESETLTFVAQGKRAPEIRDAMGVSIYTVRTHLRNLYAKIGVHSYAEAMQVLESTPVDEADWRE